MFSCVKCTQNREIKAKLSDNLSFIAQQHLRLSFPFPSPKLNHTCIFDKSEAIRQGWGGKKSSWRILFVQKKFNIRQMAMVKNITAELSSKNPKETKQNWKFETESSRMMKKALSRKLVKFNRQITPDESRMSWKLHYCCRKKVTSGNLGLKLMFTFEDAVRSNKNSIECEKVMNCKLAQSKSESDLKF